MPGANSIDGISSGFDTTAMVDAIIGQERINAVFLENRHALNSSIVTALQALQAKFISLGSSLTVLSRKATFENYAVSVSDDDVLTASTSGRVGTGTYDVQVLTLARNHQIASQGFASSAQATFGTGSVTIQVGDGSQNVITIDATSNSLEGIKTAINSANIGVSASIINDGSDSKAYRLIISSNETGVDSQISFSSSLTGGDTLNFSTSTFDDPEITNKDLASTSAISLYATAAYSGSENKTYTFTVQGIGTQTVGAGSILIDWDDGTNTGTISVDEADAEVILAGVGSDGLTLSFTDGALTAGDTFQVQGFAPLLQGAADAKIAFGSASGSSGSPITVTSSSNTFDNVISGLSLTVNKTTTPGTNETISTSLDTAAVQGQIQAFIDQYNAIQEFIDDQNTYDVDAEESGILFGDSTVMSMQSSLRMVVASAVNGIDTKFNQLYAIGIRSGADSTLSIKDSSALTDALQNNLDDVISIFTTSGDSDTNYISLVTASDNIVGGSTFEVDVTKAATHGGYTGTQIDDPSGTALTLDSTNNKLKLIVDGIISDEIALTAGTYNTTADLVAEIQAKMDADSKIGVMGASVVWVDDGGGQGHLSFESNTYGETSSIKTIGTQTDNAYLKIGMLMGAAVAGGNVEGTINGELADGRGQYLTGKDDNDTTAGLKLKIIYDESQLVDGNEGIITVSKGVASRMGDIVGSLTKASEGTFYRKISSYRAQNDLLLERVEDIDERLARRRESLYKRFWAMEQAIGQFNSQGLFLDNQLASINANWGFGSK